MLPRPACKYGYSQDQLVDILGDRMVEFKKWMRGQTISLCEGRQYNPETKEYESSGCGPHGSVIYSWDVQRFLDGSPIVD
jgi:hypothetical protein